MLNELFPRVSCVMITIGRLPYIRRSVLYYMRQSYPNKELTIVSQGSPEANREIQKYLAELNCPHITFCEAHSRLTMGEMRNLVCEIANGPLLCHWDDDDFYASNRILTQYRALQSDAHAVASAYCCFLKYIVKTGEVYWCDWSSHPKRAWQHHPGTVLFYKRVFDAYSGRLYPESNLDEDLDALRRMCDCGAIVSIPAAHDFIYIYHGDNLLSEEQHLGQVRKSRGRELMSAKELLRRRSDLEAAFQSAGITRPLVVRSPDEIAFTWTPH